MPEATEYLREKILRVERERANASAKATDYRAKAADMEAKAQELDVVLRHLKEWANEIGVEGHAFLSPSDTAKLNGSFSANSVPVRHLVKRAFTRLHRFSAADLVAEVHKSQPLAKEPSIRAELSRAKKRNDVVLLDKDLYESKLYLGEDAENSPVLSTDLEEDEEPDDEFGTLANEI